MANNRPAAQWVEAIGSVGVIIAASILVDPVQRRNTREALERALASARRLLAGPVPRTPHPWEIAALQDEARRITREAVDDGKQ